MPSEEIQEIRVRLDELEADIRRLRGKTKTLLASSVGPEGAGNTKMDGHGLQLIHEGDTITFDEINQGYIAWVDSFQADPFNPVTDEDNYSFLIGSRDSVTGVDGGYVQSRLEMISVSEVNDVENANIAGLSANARSGGEGGASLAGGVLSPDENKAILITGEIINDTPSGDPSAKFEVTLGDYDPATTEALFRMQPDFGSGSSIEFEADNINITGDVIFTGEVEGVGSQTMRGLHGVPYPWDPSELSGLSDVTVSSNTTYNTEAQRVQVCRDFTLSGAFTLTAKEGLLVFCRNFTINNASGLIDARGTNGANASGSTAGAGGVSTGIGSSGGDGANGSTGGAAPTAASTPTAITATSNTPNITGASAAIELAMLQSSITNSGFDAATWGLGGRGGSGGGGGADGTTDGGAAGSGGAATSFLNATGGAAPAAATGSNDPGTPGNVASTVTLSDGFARLIGNLIPLWYFGAGTGGGGGGGGGGAGANTGGGGGGGGAGGNPIMIVCDTFNNVGTINTSGGNGGNGATNDDTGGGGGGGGGAGTLIVVCRNLTAQGTLTASGGTPGSGPSAPDGDGGGGANGTIAGTGSVGYLLIRAA